MVDDVEETKIEEEITKSEAKDKIDHYAEMWGVSSHLMHYIVQNESSFRKDVVGDMHITCARTGEPVRARGPVQITECWYPQVTDAQAFDWDYSLNFLAKKLANGKCHEWTTCRRYYKHIAMK